MSQSIQYVQDTTDTEEEWITLNDEMIKELKFAKKNVLLTSIKRSLKQDDYRITTVYGKGNGCGGCRYKKQISMKHSAYNYFVSKAQMHRSVRENNKTGVHYLYIIHNPMYRYYGSNVYKVGYSTDVERRVNDNCAFLLEKCSVLYKKEVSSMKDEKKLHDLLHKYRMRQNREFFDCPLEVIKQAIDSIV
jgi:hypothetical protein